MRTSQRAITRPWPSSAQIADERWDLSALRTRMLASQEQRRLVVRALGTGVVTAWDHHVPDDSADRYISSGRDFWGALEQSRLPAPDGS